jgi:small GTP-binding protein
MPANLPPQYYEADRLYRDAATIPEKITALEELIRTVPKHKGTEKLRGDLRKRLSKLKSSSQASKKVSRHDSLFHIEREGAGQVVLIGPANVGKSALVTALTNASPAVAESPFTTWTPTPGMMEVKGVQIQLVDTPPLNREYLEPELLDLIRRADLVLLVVDLHTYPVQQLEESLATLAKYRIAPSLLSENYANEEKVAFLPFLVLVNKNDDESYDEVYEIFCALVAGEWPCLPVSATTGRRLDALKVVIFDKLNLIRVYARPPGEEPDLSTPFVLTAGDTIADLAGKVHKDFYQNLKFARLWGTGVFEGQMVGREHVLHDGDIVELRI